MLFPFSRIFSIFTNVSFTPQKKMEQKFILLIRFREEVTETQEREVVDELRFRVLI